MVLAGMRPIRASSSESSIFGLELMAQKRHKMRYVASLHTFNQRSGLVVLYDVVYVVLWTRLGTVMFGTVRSR
jgi:hypothetical protein